MTATLDLFQDHSTEQAATRGGNCGVAERGDRDRQLPARDAVNESSAERATLVRVNAAEGPAGAGYQGSAPQVPQPTKSASGTFTPAAQTCGSCGNGSPYKFGFLKCDYLPAWRWMAGHASCAFQVSQWVPIDAASLAKRDAQRGIDQAADAQEQRSHGWSDRAFDFIKEFCEQNRGREFIGAEVVSASLQTNLPRPENLKAWGRPLQRAARAGVIVKAGYAPDPARHGNPVPLWKAA